MEKIINKHKGFTLIELIVVILIVGILAKLAGMRWFNDSLNLDAQTTLFVSDLRSTQMMAMANGERYQLTKTSTNSYQIVNSTNAVFNNVVLSQGISFGAWNNLVNNYIVFDSKGVPYVDNATPGTALNTLATIVISAQSGSRSVTITPQTGRITP